MNKVLVYSSKKNQVSIKELLSQLWQVERTSSMDEESRDLYCSALVRLETVCRMAGLLENQTQK